MSGNAGQALLPAKESMLTTWHKLQKVYLQHLDHNPSRRVQTNRRVLVVYDQVTELTSFPPVWYLPRDKF